MLLCVNYNAHGLSAVPVSTFSDASWAGNAAAAVGVVIVIISFFWSLKLRTWEASSATPPPRHGTQITKFPDLIIS